LIDKVSISVLLICKVISTNQKESREELLTSIKIRHKLDKLAGLPDCRFNQTSSGAIILIALQRVCHGGNGSAGLEAEAGRGWHTTDRKVQPTTGFRLNAIKLRKFLGLVLTLKVWF
jgi:hypothetical protein